MITPGQEAWEVHQVVTQATTNQGNGLLSPPQTKRHGAWSNRESRHVPLSAP